MSDWIRTAFRLALIAGLGWCVYPTVADAIPSSNALPRPSTGSAAHTAAADAQPAVTTPSTTPSAPVAVKPTDVPSPAPSMLPTTTTSIAPPPTRAAVAVPAPAPVSTVATVVAAAQPAPTTVAALPACDGSGSELLAATNTDRRANGVSALCADDQLNELAQTWAVWMAQNHSLTHRDLGAAILGTPYFTMAENILVGPRSLSAAAMESAWMQSPEHRTNLLNGAYSRAGFGVAYDTDGRVWAVVDFGG